MLTACKSPREGELDFLLGHWVKLEQAETKTHEIWKKQEANCYLGHGFILKGTDTLWQEKMKLENDFGYWVMKVVTPGNQDTVHFAQHLLEHHSIVVENLQHDFPQKISYRLSGDTLKAHVSNESKKLDYTFVRQE
jgi:hypothetical protein